MQTGYDLIWLAAERTPDHIAIVDDRSDRRLTYRQLMHEVDEVAAGLFERGITAGSRVATALPNLFEHCLLLLALQRLAAVPALLNFRLSAEQLAALVADGEMSGAVILNEPEPAARIAAALPPSGVLLMLGGAPEPAHDFKLCRGDVSKLPPIPKPHPDDIAYIFYTSGTTGDPKGVLVAHRTTEHRIACLAPLAGLRNGTQLRSLGAVPLFHAIGFYCVFMVTLAYNGTFHTLSAFSPAAAVDLIERHRITFLFAVPTIIQAIVRAPNYRPERVASLELTIHGGSAIAPLLLDQICDEWRGTVCHLYGATEIMIPFYNHAPRDDPTRFNVGYYHRARVVRIGGGPQDLVAPEAAGELLIDATTNSIFSGYLNRPAATAEKVRGGWYFTGDVCIRHADGTFDLIGRVDDAIRSGAETVYPEEVEGVLAAHPDVHEVCVVGVPDDLWGEMIVACIVRRRLDLSWRELDAHCLASRLAGFKRPKAYVFVSAVPRNAANKVLRRLVKSSAITAAKEVDAIHRVAA
jgi:2-furoate---CoA ligase